MDVDGIRFPQACPFPTYVLGRLHGDPIFEDSAFLRFVNDEEEVITAVVITYVVNTMSVRVNT